MSLNEQIKGLMQQRTVKLEALETLVTTVESEARDFTEEETEKFNNFKADIKDLDSRINRLQETEQLLAAQKAVPASPTAPTGPTGNRSPIVALDRKIDDPGLFFAKQAHALYVNDGSRSAAADYAERMWGDQVFANCMRLPPQVIKHASVDPGQSGVAGWAAELVKIQQANEAFIDILRPMSVVARFPGRQMNFAGDGSIKIPRKTVKSTGTWVGEYKAIKVDRITLDAVTLTPKKNANIITSTQELLVRSDPSALMIIRDDILTGVAENIDAKFVSADAEVAGVSPAGIQTFDSSADTSTGATLDAITADLKKLLNAMLSINMPMMRPVWLMNPTNVNALRFIRDGMGQYAYKDEISQGTIVGYPFLESTTVPANIVMIADASQIIIASELAPQIALSEDASLHMEDTAPADDIGGATSPVASMFQMNAVAIRAITTLDWNARHGDCVQVLDTVAWNA